MSRKKKNGFYKWGGERSWERYVCLGTESQNPIVCLGITGLPVGLDWFSGKLLIEEIPCSGC